MTARAALVDSTFSIYGVATNNATDVSGAISLVTVSGAHAVERDGDMGLWDTVSNVAVRPDQCLINGKFYPNQ